MRPGPGPDRYRGPAGHRATDLLQGRRVDDREQVRGRRDDALQPPRVQIPAHYVRLRIRPVGQLLFRHRKAQCERTIGLVPAPAQREFVQQTGEAALHITPLVGEDAVGVLRLPLVLLPAEYLDDPRMVVEHRPEPVGGDHQGAHVVDGDHGRRARRSRQRGALADDVAAGTPGDDALLVPTRTG